MKPEKIGTYYDSIAQARMDALPMIYDLVSSSRLLPNDGAYPRSGLASR